MDPDKLAKVLAMAESEHQGEALSALRAARIMLSRAGLSFRDLAERARPDHRPSEPPPTIVTPATPAEPPPPAQLVQSLRRQVRDLELELATLRRQLDKNTGELDRHRDEAERWRTLARETAEKLWDMGKALESKHSRHTNIDKRRAVLDLLQDPGSALLSDQEIARRIGISSHLVAHWRRRLAIVGRKLRLLPVVSRGRGLWGSPTKRLPALDRERRRWPGYTTEITIAGHGTRGDAGAGGPPYGTKR